MRTRHREKKATIANKPKLAIYTANGPSSFTRWKIELPRHALTRQFQDTQERRLKRYQRFRPPRVDVCLSVVDIPGSQAFLRRPRAAFRIDRLVGRYRNSEEGWPGLRP